MIIIIALTISFWFERFSWRLELEDMKSSQPCLKMVGKTGWGAKC